MLLVAAAAALHGRSNTDRADSVRHRHRDVEHRRPCKPASVTCTYQFDIAVCDERYGQGPWVRRAVGCHADHAWAAKRRLEVTRQRGQVRRYHQVDCSECTDAFSGPVQQASRIAHIFDDIDPYDLGRAAVAIALNAGRHELRYEDVGLQRNNGIRVQVYAECQARVEHAGHAEAAVDREAQEVAQTFGEVEVEFAREAQRGNITHVADGTVQ